MKKMMEKTIGLLVVAGATSIWATNGMDMEGYGPEAQAMGGASIAIDNGTAAVINNPATLSLIPEGGQRIDVALGVLGPDVRASVKGAPEAKSNGDSYLMPAFGWAKRKGDFVYGIGVFGQGGMGTDYSENSFLALNSGNEVRSEISVGRVIAPLSYDVSEKLSIGGTLDLVWAGMDMRMAMTAPQAMGMVTGMPTLPLPQLGQNDYIRLDFSDRSAFLGEAKGLGGSAKVGALYTVNDKMRVGVMYHHKTELGDLKSKEAELSFGSSATGQKYGKMPGTVTIDDFAWPSLVGGGVSVEATERLTLAFDVRYIFWHDVMDAMNMTFKGDDGAGKVKMRLPQDWEDQTVFQVGAQFQATDLVVLRAGYNYGKNPVPESLTNPLFPAIVEHHITGGVGLALAEGQSLDMSVVYAPETEVTNADGVTSKHSQLNAQLMYSYRF